MNVVIAAEAWGREFHGGAARMPTEFAEHLAATGHRVFYICGSAAHAVPEPITHAGVEVLRYPLPGHPSPHPMNLLVHLRSSARLARLATRAARIDLLYGHQPLQFLGAHYGLRRASRPRPRSVYTAHSPFAEEVHANWDAGPVIQGDAAGGSQGGRRAGWRARARAALTICRAVERAVYRRADRIHAASRFTQQRIEATHRREIARKVFVEALWVDSRRFHPAADRRLVRRRLGGIWDHDGFVFFSVRRLVPRMGLDMLIEAFRRIEPENDNCRLVIGGAGPERARLESLAAAAGLGDSVRFAGLIPDGELPDCHAAADCFVLPSRALECFGLVILEAWASGVPVVATPTGAIPEVLGEECSAWVTRDTSAESLAEKMRAVSTGSLAGSGEAFRRLAESYDLRERAEILWRRLSA